MFVWHVDMPCKMLQMRIQHLPIKALGGLGLPHSTYFGAFLAIARQCRGLGWAIFCGALFDHRMDLPAKFAENVPANSPSR